MQYKCSHFGGPQSWVFKISSLALLERPSTFEDWIGCHSDYLPWSQVQASATGELWWSQLGAPPTSPEKQGVSERIVGKIIRTMKCVQEESRASVQACRGSTNASICANNGCRSCNWVRVEGQRTTSEQRDAWIGTGRVATIYREEGRGATQALSALQHATTSLLLKGTSRDKKCIGRFTLQLKLLRLHNHKCKWWKCWQVVRNHT